jgi:hypothetical protein
VSGNNEAIAQQPDFFIFSDEGSKGMASPLVAVLNGPLGALPSVLTSQLPTNP